MTKARGRENWIEEYVGCGCIGGAEFKKDLRGYCADHGNDRRRVYDVREETIAAMRRKPATTAGKGTR